MSEEKRRVIFTLEGEEEPVFLDYESQQEFEETTKKRKGLFHHWCEDKKNAIVEDVESGKVCEVFYSRIQFAD